MLENALLEFCGKMWLLLALASGCSPTADRDEASPGGPRESAQEVPESQEDAGVTILTWDLGRFEALSDDDVEREREFYGGLRRAWTGGDGTLAFRLATEELAREPERIELHLARAVSVLLEERALAAPLLALSEGRAVEVPLDLLLYVVAEYQKSLPPLEGGPGGQASLHHPLVHRRLGGELPVLWSHGLRPMVRLRALEEGQLEIYEDFAGEAPSLLDVLLNAQLLAVRGETAEARAQLRRLEENLAEHVAEDAVDRWSPRLAALDELCADLPGKQPGLQLALLGSWEAATVRAIPELGQTVLTLPPAAVSRATSPEKAPPPPIPADGEVLARLAGVAATTAPRRNVLSDEEKHLIGVFHSSLLRYRDFRADTLLRVCAGKSDGVISRGIVSDDGLLFGADGSVVEFREYRGEEPQAGRTRIRCLENWWLTLE